VESAMVEGASPIIGLGLGLIHGFAFAKSGSAEPDLIRKQMRLEDYTMAKTFFSAALAETSALTALYASGLIDISTVPQSLLSQAVGGAVLGTGIYLSGSSPEAVFVQVGNKKKEALCAVGGGLLGSLLYGFTHEKITKLLSKAFTTTLLKPETNEMLAQTDSSLQFMGLPLWAISLPICAALAGGLAFLETIQPTESKVHKESDNMSLVEKLSRQKKWSPYVCGSILGLIQIPAFLLWGAAASPSSVFVSAAGYIADLFGKVPKYFKPDMVGQRPLWRLLLGLGIIGGSYYAYQSYWKVKKQDELAMNKEPKDIPISYKNAALSAVGGAMMLYGSRLAPRFSPVTVFSMFTSGFLASTLIPARVFDN